MRFSLVDLRSGKAGRSIGSSGGRSTGSAFLPLKRRPIEPAPTSRAPAIISQCGNSNHVIVEYALTTLGWASDCQRNQSPPVHAGGPLSVPHLAHLWRIATKRGRDVR